METEMNKALPKRPLISDFQDPVDFMRAMIEFRKKTDKLFSVHTATASLRKVSPALVSLILKKQRKITLERVDEFAKLLQLNATEKIYFRNWIERSDRGFSEPLKPEASHRQRKDVGTHILSDWINVYVKDCFQLAKVQSHPELVHQYLASYANPKRIEKSIDFLLKEGHLRRTMDGKVVVETNLAVANPQVPSKKIRQFHKGALGVAKAALDLFPASERMANTLVIPLNDKSYLELLELIREFSEKLQDFAAQNQEPGERLYQLIVNLSPTGGKVE
jgi:uncharacterized protein (TIGR02147 family)